MGEFFYNNTKHLSTQQTPFMVDTGRNPHMGFEPQQPCSNLELVNAFVEHIALGIAHCRVMEEKFLLESLALLQSNSFLTMDESPFGSVQIPPSSSHTSRRLTDEE
jgi:hypothetical protein